MFQREYRTLEDLSPHGDPFSEADSPQSGLGNDADVSTGRRCATAETPSSCVPSATFAPTGTIPTSVTPTRYQPLLQPGHQADGFLTPLASGISFVMLAEALCFRGIPTAAL